MSRVDSTTVQHVPSSLEPWEHGVLDIYDWRQPGLLSAYFGVVEESLSRQGDLCEIGVYRGRSLVATAMYLRARGSSKLVYGFDSFSGFPEIAPEDKLERFDTLYDAGLIDEDHHRRVNRNQELLSAVGRSGDPSRSSTSGDFSMTSRDLVEAKLKVLGLENVVLIEGPFQETMHTGLIPDARFATAFFDCDLYQSYRAALPFVWDRLVEGGVAFLDEYYSLKFPGARIAVDQFVAGRDDTQLSRVDDATERWERWALRKVGSKA